MFVYWIHLKRFHGLRGSVGTVSSVKIWAVASLDQFCMRSAVGIIGNCFWGFMAVRFHWIPWYRFRLIIGNDFGRVCPNRFNGIHWFFFLQVMTSWISSLRFIDICDCRLYKRLFNWNEEQLFLKNRAQLCLRYLEIRAYAKPVRSRFLESISAATVTAGYLRNALI